LQLTVTDAVFAEPAYCSQKDATLTEPSSEWVVGQLHQQKGTGSSSAPTICNSALMITTEAMVAEAPKKDEPAMPPGGGMGGMGGMDF
ncbi:hypothetical protein J4V51_26555, partial [Escherichia coli]